MGPWCLRLSTVSDQSCLDMGLTWDALLRASPTRCSQLKPGQGVTQCHLSWCLIPSRPTRHVLIGHGRLPGVVPALQTVGAGGGHEQLDPEGSAALGEEASCWCSCPC